MSYNELRARGVLLKCEERRERIQKELEDIKDVEAVAKQYLLTIYGPCKECQNGHWPHCSEED